VIAFAGREFLNNSSALCASGSENTWVLDSAGVQSKERMFENEVFGKGQANFGRFVWTAL
jgi:hypothetical protein